MEQRSKTSRSKVQGAISAWVAVGATFALATSAAVIATVPAATAAAAVPEPVVITETVSNGFVHPGIGVSADSLRNARDQVQAGVEPWASYYAAMNETAFASRTLRSANAGTVLDQPKNPVFASQGTQSLLIRDAFGAYTQAILYVMTGDPVYRENGLRIIRIWSHMDPARYAYYPDAHIHSGVPLYRLLAAAEIFRSTSFDGDYAAYDLAWHEQDDQLLTDNLIVPMTETFLHTNWRYLNQHGYPLTGAIAGYIFTENRERYEEAVEWYTVNATTTRPEQNGSMASLFRRIEADDPLNPYGYSFVQHQEMGRDQAHAWDGVNIQGALARFLTVQGTTLDPVAGTVSDAPDAVSPYEFLDRRLLAGADTFVAYMLGYDVPWIDTTGGPGALSEAYRGRIFNPIDELYHVYKYDLGVDVETEAPHLAELHAKADGPTFFWGTGAYNSWEPNPDYSPEFWLSLPAEIAGEKRPVAVDNRVQLETRSSAVAGTSAVLTEGDRSFVRMKASKAGNNTVAVRTLMYVSRSADSPVGVLVRTDGEATLAIGKDPARRLNVLVPNTRGEWRYVTFDVDGAKLPGSLGGENLAYFSVLGEEDVRVDIDHVDLMAKTTLTVPRFDTVEDGRVLAVAGAPLVHSLAATDAGGDALRYTGVRLPAGARLDPATGELTWTPRATQAGIRTFDVAADDGQSVSVLRATVVVAPDRAAALDEALVGYDPGAAYVSDSLAAFEAVRQEAVDALESADDATFLAGLVRLQEAVRGLKLLTPRLADGAVDLRGLVTPAPTTINVNNLVDGDFNTTTGDLRAPFTLDFGERFRFSAGAIGLQARYNFANRSQGANAYGSNDGRTWTLLTERETTNTTADGFVMETIPVRGEVRGQTFRFLKVQVDHPGVPTDPAYPGISSFSEVRIHGERHEMARVIESVSIASSNADPGLAVDGDTVTLDVVALEPLAEVRATVEGVPATVTSTDPRTWRAQVVLPDDIEFGRALRFVLDYRTAAGVEGATVLSTTDGSSLQLWNSSLVKVPVVPAWVNASTPLWPGTGTTQANGWRMFDGDVTTFTDTTASNGWVTVTPTDGTPITVDLIRMHPRSTHLARAIGTEVQGSNDGGVTWQTFWTFNGIANPDWYLFELPQRVQYDRIRVLDEHGGNVNIAELQLLARR